MRPIVRQTALALAVVAALLWALARNLGRAGVPPTLIAPAVPAATAAPVHVVKKRRKAPKVLVTLAVPLREAPVAVRGARLREKGEAMGGRAPDAVDAATATIRQ